MMSLEKEGKEPPTRKPSPSAYLEVSCFAALISHISAKLESCFSVLLGTGYLSGAHYVHSDLHTRCWHFTCLKLSEFSGALTSG